MSGPPMRETCQGNPPKCCLSGDHGGPCVIDDEAARHCPGCPDLHGGERAGTGAPGDALTPARLEELERAYAAMTQGTAFPIRVHDADTPEKMVEAVRISIESSPGTEMFGVNINGNPDTIELGPDERCVALTGNGPTSEANAVGIAALVNAFPALLAAARERIEGWKAAAIAEAQLLGAAGREHGLRQQVATLTAERDAIVKLWPALERAASAAFRPSCQGTFREDLAVVVEQFRAALNAAPLPRERGADTPGGALADVLDYLRLLDPEVRAANAPAYLERLLTLLGPTVGGADLLSPEERKRFEKFRYLRSIVAEVPLHTVSETGKSLQSTIGFLFELVDRLAPRLPDPSGGRA